MPLPFCLRQYQLFPCRFQLLVRAAYLKHAMLLSSNKWILTGRVNAAEGDAEGELRTFTSQKQGYTLRIPSAWEQKSKSGRASALAQVPHLCLAHVRPCKARLVSALGLTKRAACVEHGTSIADKQVPMSCSWARELM